MHLNRERILQRTILQGGLSSVITGLRIKLTKNRIRGRRRKDVEKATTYFENHKEFMHYEEEYLAAGYPIATGVVESACGHLIKDCMGKMATQHGAEFVLKLRRVKASGDWPNYLEIRKLSEHNRPYS